MEQSMPYEPPNVTQHVILENHWNSTDVTMREVTLLRENPSRYVNDLIYELETLQKDRDHFLNISTLAINRRRDAEERWTTLQSEWVKESKATAALATILGLLQDITNHQGRCAAKDICSDHDNIVTLAKVVKEWIEDNT